jgi:opacity protein-like surface antigen
MKKLIMFGVLLVIAIFGMAASDCIAEEKLTEPKITIVLEEDGSLYKMNEGDRAQWDFFVTSNQNVKITEVLVVLGNDTRTVANVRIVENGQQRDISGYNTKERNFSIIKNVIAAAQDAIMHRN